MGKLILNIGVEDQQGNRFQDVQVTVPRRLLESLDVPVARQATSRMVDGRTTTVDVGWTIVRLQDQVLPTQVIFAEENEPSLLGVVTLGEALLAVDPVRQRLIPVDADRLLTL